jgi:serine/threonine protein kinase
MELGGENLGRFIRSATSKSRGRTPVVHPMMLRDIWRQMVRIVATLHGNSIVHMDLKPENLIFFGPILKIADLGISRKVNVLG